MTIELRKARASDIEAINAVALAAKAHWGYSDVLMTAFATELQWHEDDLHSARAITIVATPRDKDSATHDLPVGFCRIVWHGAELGELDALFIHPDWIDSGVGRRLLVATCRESVRWSLTRLQIQSDPYAEGFYLRMGATRIGTRPSGSVRGRDLPLLELNVDEFLAQFQDGG